MAIWRRVSSLARRSPAPPPVPVRVPRPPRRFELPLPEGRTLVVEAPRKLRIPRLLQEEGLRGHEAATLACLLAATERREAGTLFDVGANVGVFSLLVSSLANWNAVAFEPTPRVAATARRMAELNACPVRVEELALGREAGSATFYLSRRSDASNSLNPEFREAKDSLTVPVETLDGFCVRTGLVPDVIKIDTESTEADVLAGGLEVLRTHRPWLFIEVLDTALGSEIAALLDPLGYHAHPIRDTLPPEPSPVIESIGLWQRNWLFTPEPLDPAYGKRTVAWAATIAATPLPQEATDER
jgi:FkbM family methyltransferase